VFALDRRIYEIGADGGGGKRMNLSCFRHPLVRWSPDGTRLLVASGRYAWVTEADGGIGCVSSTRAPTSVGSFGGLLDRFTPCVLIEP
jgi:hypothetical protein